MSVNSSSIEKVSKHKRVVMFIIMQRQTISSYHAHCDTYVISMMIVM